MRTPAPPLTSPLAPRVVETFLELRKDVIPMLTTLGPELHVDPLLIYKVKHLKIRVVLIL